MGERGSLNLESYNSCYRSYDYPHNILHLCNYYWVDWIENSCNVDNWVGWVDNGYVDGWVDDDYVDDWVDDWVDNDYVDD
jgi:hypothetical protein